MGYEQKVSVAYQAALKYMGRTGINSNRFSGEALYEFAINIANDLVRNRNGRYATVNGMRFIETLFGDYVEFE